MVSVIITTKDEVHLVEPSIRSIVNQEFEGAYEIMVIDDGSTDGTVGEIRRIFGKDIKIIEKKDPNGWLNSLQLACKVASSELLVISGPHCMVKPDWLDTIVHCFRSDPGLSVITGPAFHGYSFMQKLSALTLHAQFVSPKRGYAKHIFDANFAIKKDTLASLLLHLPVEKNLNDGIGCALLSSQTKQQGIPVLYEPRMAAFHISPDFKGYLEEWKGITAENSIDIRLLDSSIRGAGLLNHMFFAPLIYPCVRTVIDIKNAWYFKKALGLTYTELPFLLMADVIGKTWYCVGLVSAVKNRRRSNPGWIVPYSSI